MDLYTSALILGGSGLALMAIGGFTKGGDHGAHGSHGSNGHGGHHAGHDAHAGGHAHHGHDSHAGHHGSHHDGHHPASQSDGSNRLDSVLAFLSPRVWFSVSVGFGAAGVIMRGFMGGIVLFAVSLAVGIAFEWLLVAPFWRFLFRFASSPALTLESAIEDVAKAVTSFDAKGQGLISIEVDGQVHQVLATLTQDDRAAGARVRAGDEVRIQDVDSSRNTCTVSITRR